MKLTPEEAREMFCCNASHPADNGLCNAEKCAAWRWLPLSASDPEFVAAIKKAMPDHKNNHKAAVKYVMDNREELGLPTIPTHGYCGLAGKPEA